MADPDEATLVKVRAGMRAVKVASAYDKVYNDECVLSFDTPFSPDGLYVSLSSFQGYGQRHVALDHEKTGTALYVHLKWTKVPKEAPPEDKEAPPAWPSAVRVASTSTRRSSMWSKTTRW